MILSPELERIVTERVGTELDAITARAQERTRQDVCRQIEGKQAALERWEKQLEAREAAVGRQESEVARQIADIREYKQRLERK